MTAVCADPLTRMSALIRAPEPELLAGLLRESQGEAGGGELDLRRALTEAASSGPRGLVAPLLAAFGLDTEAGQTLMSLAEAFLRVPDAATADALIASKLRRVDWAAHPLPATSPAWLKLMLGGLQMAQSMLADGGTALTRPLIRGVVRQAMQRMGRYFVLGETIESALKRAEALRPAICSFDMLGEGARTAAAAERYFQLYSDTIDKLARASRPGVPLLERHGVSVKLSALHPRYEAAQAGRCVPELTAMLLALAEKAAAAGIGLTVDAEETERLVMSLEVIGAVARHPRLAGWEGLGMAVQAYQKRAPAVIDWAAETSALARRKLAVRLVKGAYWDSEIRRCQLDGLNDYPVFTRKAATDVSYLACARRMLGAADLQPAFATHNALTVAALMSWIGPRRDVEFQRLHGMGESLYRRLRKSHPARVRVYAPVGNYQDLLPYLVRRLLENGANSSFVNQAAQTGAVIRDPRAIVAANGGALHAAIAAPPRIFGAARRNAMGIDMADRLQLAAIGKAIEQDGKIHHRAAPLIGGETGQGRAKPVVNPATGAIIGEVIAAGAPQCEAAVTMAMAAQAAWSDLPVAQRAACLERTADLLERDHLALIALLVREAGKTQSDALGEVREAVDFCRYYAAEAHRLMQPLPMPGPTGESNELRLAGRGVFLCISPWNFPLAIFTGQIAAALVTGNAVVAKPAPQTPLIAMQAVRRLHEAGVPAAVLHLLPGGAEVGRALVADERINGVVFTGSTAAAKQIARSLNASDTRPLVPLIAETGGINAMIVDSTALPEQVVRDVMTSAFQSAGQRCSALRLLCLQEEIADEVIALLQGAMAELKLGDPAEIATDIGPVIDSEARQRIAAYLEGRSEAIITKISHIAPQHGNFIAPAAIVLKRPEDLDREVFGPVLHVVRWKGSEADQIIASINRLGYGLTLGIQSRVPDLIDRIRKQAKVGNIYVNRSMIGAVVGVQPFGGENLSGTGPKAGGPFYLPRFCVERTVSIDLTAIGGNTQLLAQNGNGEQ